MLNQIQHDLKLVNSSAVENSKREYIWLNVSSSAVENNKSEYISTALDVTEP